ncbi:hypothetical protein TNCV_5039651 [Trichonephila clavipes]|nr:hypothetical protein TNCV_5039651 [Trichonephila clavipes]
MLVHILCDSPNNVQGYDVLPWPARTPDLSPIEHVCDALGTSKTVLCSLYHSIIFLSPSVAVQRRLLKREMATDAARLLLALVP